MALTLSLRRYFPALFSSLSVNRLLIELLVIGGSLFGSTISVVIGASPFIHALKKGYILEADSDIYQYMRNMKNKYDALLNYQLSNY